MAAENSCNVLVQKLKASNLHYRLSENPFSIQIMIRKRFIDDQIPNYNNENNAAKFKQLEDELAIKATECDKSKSEVKDLKEELAKVSEELHVTKVELTKTHSNTKREKSKLEKELKTIKIAAEKKEVEFEKDLKHYKVIIEKKETRIQEVINANKNLNKQIIAETKSKASSTSTSIQTSRILSSSKSSNTPLLSSNSKSTNTDSNSNLIDASATSTSGPSTKDSQKSFSSNKPSKFTQTEPHPEIPYNVTSPLPPIFNSQLCHQSKRLPYLSNSLPNLHTIDWVTVMEGDKIRDMAEEALCDQYDRQVEDFYHEARDKARALREIYSENIIRNLFEEKEND